MQWCTNFVGQGPKQNAQNHQGHTTVKIKMILQFYTRKKALREMQTLRAGCSKVEPKIFTQPQTPFPGVRDGQNLTSWRWSLLLPINRVWWGEDRCMQFQVIMVRDPQTHTHSPTHKHTHPPTHTDRTDYNTLHCS